MAECGDELRRIPQEVLKKVNTFKKAAFSSFASAARLGAIISAVFLASGLSSKAATVSFTDNFTPSASPLWNNYAGNWATSNGQYYAQQPNNSPSTFTGLPYELTNYTLTVTINNLGDAGIWLRGNGSNQIVGSSPANGILLIIGGGGYGQGTRGGAAGTSLYWVTPEGGSVNQVQGVFTPGGTYTITVTVNGNVYSVYINGSSTPATTLVNSDFTYGQVGLYDDQPNTITASGSGPPTTFSGFSLSGALYSGSVIGSVGTAYAGSEIAQNTFIVIKGANLVPATTSANGQIWSSAPSFASGQMPTQLGGVSVTVNNNPAFVYFYCSAATDPSCAVDQINVLTPLDNTTGPVSVVVTSGSLSTQPFTTTMQTAVPSFLLFSTAGYVAATHVNGALLGPASLYPGSSTPAMPGETVVLYAVGFGLPTGSLVNGSATQSGSLPTLPVCTIGGNPAVVGFAGLISPGLYQLNVTVPMSAANGDNPVSCSYEGFTTPTGDLITVQ